MYYFFYGENFYSIKQKIQRIKEKFLESDPSALNLSLLSGAGLTKDRFWREALAAPFLATKRLLICKNLLLENKDDAFKKDLTQKLDKIPATTLVFFIEDGTPDKRGALFKALNKPGVAQNFASPGTSTLAELIEKKAQESKIRISAEAKNLLLLYIGNSLYRAESEITKLILCARGNGLKTIEADLVKKMVQPEEGAGIFEFVDAIGNKNQKLALETFDKLVKAGENELYILSMICYQYRTMLIILDLINKKTPKSEIGRIGKLHPFVVQKTVNLLRTYNEEDLIEKYIQIEEADFRIKNGQVDSKLCLLMLISDFCRD